MKFTDIFIKRPVLAICISMIFIILGLNAMNNLQVREYPKMTNTTITVETTYAGADAATMQAFVTSVLEESIAEADNVDYISSSSSPGTSTIEVVMKLNTDPSIATSDVSSKVNAVRSQLPDGIDDPTISSAAGATNALMYMSFNSDELEAPQVVDYINRVVKPQLFSVSGVSQVSVWGSAYALRIWLDPDKMAGYNLPVTTVTSALSANNVQTAAGNSNGYYTVYKNRVESTTRSVEQLKEVVVYTSSDGKQVKLKDIADVTLDKSSDSVRAEVNGKVAINLALSASPSANPLTVTADIRPVFAEIQKNLPSSISGSIMYDRTIAINNSINEVIKTIFEATAIVLVVITLFLGSFRAMVIPVVTIPISLIGAIMLLQGFGFTINLMTLLALVLAIGLVVDDAIVVLENVDRHIKEGETPFRAAIIGTREIAVPVISMTLALGAVYSPMALMSGVTGTLFKEFALTLAGSVFISGIVALTLSPMMSSKILKHADNPSWLEQRVERMLTRMTNCYAGLLSLVMSMRKTVIAFCVLIFATLPFLFNSLSSEIAPTEDKGVLVMMATGPANVNVDYVQEAMRPVAEKLKQIPEVETVQIVAGVPGTNQAFALILLKDWSERSRLLPAISAEATSLTRDIPEMNASVFTFPEIDTGSSGLPFSLVINTPNSYEDLANVASDILQKAQASGQFFFSQLDLKFDTVTITMNIDRDKLGAYGITVQQLSNTLGSYLSGATLARVDIDGRSYTMVSQVKRKDRLSPQDLGNYYISASNGQSVPLSAFISLELGTGPSELKRLNQLNSATITGVVSGSIGDAVDWFTAEVAPTLPQGYQYDFLNESRQYVQEGSAVMFVFALAVVIIYLVLAIQFESWRDPMVILVSVPLAVSGALLTLNILSILGVNGTTLNIYSQVGLVTLVGLITKHGILMCEVAKEEQLHRKVSRFEAIFYAAKIRLRPIMMTTAAMIAGLVPLLYASGAGAVSRFSIGIVIVAGLAIGTLFTLFILPVIYTFLASEHKPLPEFIEDEDQPKVAHQA